MVAATLPVAVTVAADNVQRQFINTLEYKKVVFSRTKEDKYTEKKFRFRIRELNVEVAVPWWHSHFSFIEMDVLLSNFAANHSHNFGSLYIADFQQYTKQASKVAETAQY